MPTGDGWTVPVPGLHVGLVRIPKKPLRNMGVPHVSSQLCRDFSLDYVTLTFGSRREGSAPKNELNQTNLCFYPKGADPSVRCMCTHGP